MYRNAIEKNLCRPSSLRDARAGQGQPVILGVARWRFGIGMATTGGSGGLGFAVAVVQPIALGDLATSKILPHTAQQHLALPGAIELLAKQ